MGARFSLRMRQTTTADAFPALSPTTLRQNIEASIERLLAMLDTLDGDPDLEPSIGWGTSLPLRLRTAVSPQAVDLEADDEDEPSLGSLDRAEDQRQWCDGTRQELDEEADDEPDLSTLAAALCIGAFSNDGSRGMRRFCQDEFDFPEPPARKRTPRRRA